MDISEGNLRLAAARARENGVHSEITFLQGDAYSLPLRDGTVDRVLCAAVLHHVDCLRAATEISRVLKAGGAAVFLEPVKPPGLLRWVKAVVPRAPGVTEDEEPLAPVQISAITARIGVASHRREFWLLYRVVSRLGVFSRGVVATICRVDAWLLARVPILREFASPVVWKVIKSAEICGSLPG